MTKNVNAAAYREGDMIALQHASIMGHFNIVHLLFENEADVNAEWAERNGRTALQGAAQHGRLDIVQLLLDNGNQPRLGVALSGGCRFGGASKGIMSLRGTSDDGAVSQ